MHGARSVRLADEATFYGVMSSNHPEMLDSYPNPMLDFMPLASQCVNPHPSI